MYDQIIQLGALKTFHIYYPTEEKIRTSIQQDQILYRSYIIQHQQNTKEERMSLRDIDNQEKSITNFPCNIERACLIFESFYKPKTKVQKINIEEMKENILLVDVYTGHITTSSHHMTRHRELYQDNKSDNRPSQLGKASHLHTSV